MPLPHDLAGEPGERVLRQLVAALLFEGLLDADIDRSGNVTCFNWTLDGTSYRCRAAVGAFGRVRVIPGSIEQRGAGGWRPAHLATLVQALPGDSGSREGLLMELERTAALCAWNQDNLPRPARRELPFDRVESTLDEGHPYHPCFKGRIGFSEEDHRAYGPEAGNDFQLVWLAVARHLLHQVLPEDETPFWRREMGEEVFALLRQRCEALGVGEDYGFLPLHPWQWADISDGALAPYLSDGQVHHLGAAGDRYRASQSVRTLFNVDRPYKASVKLAMNLVNTSTRRTLDPLSVTTAPTVSRWLERVIAGDPLFTTRYPLAILPEYAGVVADRGGPLAGQLAALWRGNIDAVLEDGEEAVPFNALMVVESDGKPFVEGWIRRYGLSNWLDRLLDVAVMPIWHLLVAHGLATECHGQNMVLVHREGWPERLVLRDFHDSLEYVPEFLREPDKAPDFLALDPAYRYAAPNEHYWMESTEALGELTVDCLFIYNLSEVSYLMQECYGLPEEHFWLRVRNRLNSYAAVHGLEARAAQVRPMAETLVTESLLSRKLYPARSDHSHRVPNLLTVSSLLPAKAS
jgi:siderophore synthetase component